VERFFIILQLLLIVRFSYSQRNIGDELNAYNIKWTSQSANSSESMPCGGGDTGLNVWVEDDDILFYMARSGTFDENNTMPKQGRVRISLNPNPFKKGTFTQELKLFDGYVEMTGSDNDLNVKVEIWTDVYEPVIHVDVEASQPVSMSAVYENWRFRDLLLRKNESFGNSYKWAPPEGLTTKRDSISFFKNGVLFFHRNSGKTVFDVAVHQQKLDSVKGRLFNPLENLTFGGYMEGRDMIPVNIVSGEYCGTPFKGWGLKSKTKSKVHNLQVGLYIANAKTLKEWTDGLPKLNFSENSINKKRLKTQSWWHQFWNRSYVLIHPYKADTADENWQAGRNYNLFRYMLGCNAYGSYPTKFNGGLFTYDSRYVNKDRDFTPDFRNWGGGTFTAQNQRLVYFPMLKSGDFEAMAPQFDFYRRLLPNAVLRSEVYWHHDGAAFTEQLENYGLPNPSEYGWKRPADYDPGMQYNAWLEYQWDTSLEFCFMMLERFRYSGKSIEEYMPLIESSIIFFDEHYRYLARRRGRKELDQDGHLVLYPGSACETYKMAYNSTSTIAGLNVVIRKMLNLPDHMLSAGLRKRLQKIFEKIPPITYRQFEGKQTIAPAQLWERINNIEVPQLYPVFPWGITGIGKPGLETARNTYLYDEDALKFRDFKGWKQDNIFAARLGFTEDAFRFTVQKLKDSDRRFSAFWGPGFDWTPDHNWGGSGMIGMQEMLMQTNGNKIYLFPAWPREQDVAFKLHAPGNTTVEAELQNGRVTFLKVEPQSRLKDVEISYTGGKE
jgi:hypothetical protein